MTEPPVEKCPVCGAKAERLLSAGAGILFKGSGFYITDYRSDSYKKAAAADSKPAADPKPASSDSTAAPAPAKTATPPEPKPKAPKKTEN